MTNLSSKHLKAYNIFIGDITTFLNNNHEISNSQEMLDLFKQEQVLISNVREKAKDAETWFEKVIYTVALDILSGKTGVDYPGIVNYVNHEACKGILKTDNSRYAILSPLFGVFKQRYFATWPDAPIN